MCGLTRTPQGHLASHSLTTRCVCVCVPLTCFKIPRERITNVIGTHKLPIHIATYGMHRTATQQAL
jgi:hypothetical protein